MLDCPEVVEHEGRAIIDLETKFATPLGEGLLLRPSSAANEAPGLAAEINKFLNCFPDIS
jgi:hypothetical protein